MNGAPVPSRQSRAAAALLHATGSAAADVIAARIRAFAVPGPWSAWQQREALRMGSEKLAAAQAGMLAASLELAMLPSRMTMLLAQPWAWTPLGLARVGMDATELLAAVGNAALRPARDAVVRNRNRLARLRH